jgi:Flp pilus assembly protein TadG
MSRESPPSTVRAWSDRTGERLKFRQSSRSRRVSRAQTTVEFALVLVPFFAILFAIIDYANVYYYNNALQNALRESARFATAGRVIQTNNLYKANSQGVEVPEAINDTEGREASRNECIRYWFQSNCVINIPATNVMIFSAPSVAGLPPSTTTNNGVLHLVSGYSYTTNGSTVTTNSVAAVAGPGAANDYVEIIATYNIGTITPILSFLGGYGGNAVPGGYNLRVSAIVKNEPAALNFLHNPIYSDEPNETTADQMK